MAAFPQDAGEDKVRFLEYRPKIKSLKNIEDEKVVTIIELLTNKHGVKTACW